MTRTAPPTPIRGTAAGLTALSAHTADETCLEARDITRRFPLGGGLLRGMLGGSVARSIQAVDGVSVRIRRGETFSLVGESGCGKSTLARIVAGLDAPSSGTIRFADARLPGHRIQMIFQDPYASLNPRYRVGTTIAEPIRFQKLLPAKAVVPRVHELLRQVGLAPADAAKFPHEFSGGQRQRVSIARALAGNPTFLICDEPTSALDVSVQAQILNLLRRLQHELGLTCLFISHNLAVINYVSHDVGVMYLGRLVEVAPTRVLFDAPKHPYTQLLLAALPRLETRARERAPISGEIASPLDPPSGCAFHPRCPHAYARCREERPELHDEPDGSRVACHAIAERRIPVSIVSARVAAHA